MAERVRLEQLEGLRGVAAFVVLLCHLRATFFIDAYDAVVRNVGHLTALFLEAALDGNFAVWLFWVLSAFVLSLRYHATSSPAASLAILSDATVRRYPRLALPVFASVLAAWAMHSAGAMSNAKLALQLGPEYAGWLGSFYAFPPSLPLAVKSALWESFFCFQRDSSYNAVLWTMEIELLGSLFLFAFLALVGKHPARLLFYALTMAICFALSLQWMNAFIGGAMLCDVFIHRDAVLASLPPSLRGAAKHLSASRCAGLACTTGLVALIGLPDLLGSLHLLLAIGVTGLVMLSRPVARVLSWRLPVFLGKISFGMYLAHVPIICAAACPLYNATRPYVSGRVTACVASVAVMVLSLAGGWCLWFLADRPAVEFSRQCAAALRVRK